MNPPDMGQLNIDDAPPAYQMTPARPRPMLTAQYELHSTTSFKTRLTRIRNATALFGLRQQSSGVFWNCKVPVIYACHYSARLKRCYETCCRKWKQQNAWENFVYPKPVVKMLADWFYNPNLLVPTMSEKDFASIVNNHVHLYLLAEEYGIQELCNQSIDMIHQINLQYNKTDVSLLVSVWKKATPENALKKYFIDRCITALPSGASRELYPQEMLFKMVTIMADYGIKENLSGFKAALDMEMYHIQGTLLLQVSLCKNNE
jgi:hypothetical protein